MKPQRILIVDDERHIVQVLSLTLSRQGYEIITAEDGDAAWLAFCQHTPDLVITDLSMPGLSGTELAQRVHPKPVMVVTARQLSPGSGGSSNITAVLPKPFSPRQVLSHVVELVGPARTDEEQLS